MAEDRLRILESNAAHDCVCLHAPGYRPKGCECGVYEDEHGRWCANENCRANLDAPQEFLRPVVGVADRHSFDGVVALRYYGGEVEIDVGGTDLVEFLTRMEGRRVHVSVERWS